METQGSKEVKRSVITTNGRWLIVFLVIITYIRFIGWNPLGSTVVEYPASCSVVVVLGKCAGMITPLNRTAYRVSDSAVTYSSEIGGEVEALSNCAVQDKNNWSCSYPDNSAQLGFRGGIFWERVNPAMDQNPTITAESIQLSRFQWYGMEWGWPLAIFGLLFT
jgi:hypothetical protein